MATKQCACGKVCGNAGALAMHKKGKMCPLKPVLFSSPLNPQVETATVSASEGDVVRMQLNNLKIEHERKMRAINELSEKELTRATEELSKASEMRAVETMRAKEELNKAAEESKKAVQETKKAVLETTRVKVDIDLMKQRAHHECKLIDEKIVRVQRTRDVYVEHVQTMTRLAEEDAHQHRLLTVSPHILTRDEMRVYGTAYLPCYAKGDIERFVDAHLALGGPKGADGVKTIVGKMALLQDSVMIDPEVSRKCESMHLVPLRSLARIHRMDDLLEAASDGESSDDEKDEEPKPEPEQPEPIKGNKLVLSFQEQEELVRSVKLLGSQPAEDVDAVNKFIEVLALAATKAVASVDRHRVHIPTVMQEFLDEQDALLTQKARKSPHNRYEFWARKTGGATEHPCETCGRALSRATFQMGHRVARARGGTFDLKNMIVQCGECNADQGVLHPELYKNTYS